MQRLKPCFLDDPAAAQNRTIISFPHNSQRWQSSQTKAPCAASPCVAPGISFPSSAINVRKYTAWTTTWRRSITAPDFALETDASSFVQSVWKLFLCTMKRRTQQQHNVMHPHAIRDVSKSGDRSRRVKRVPFVAARSVCQISQRTTAESVGRRSV